MVEISVVTAVYNAAETVGETLNSVAAQTYPDVEHVVIDGASTDGTEAVLREHLGGLRRWSLLSEPDGGIYDALNKGIARARGDVVGFLHGDDLFGSESVLTRVADAFSDPGVQAVYGDLVYVDRENPDRVIRHWRAGEFLPERLRRGWMPPHPTLYLRREVYAEFGGFDTRYRIAADYDLILRVLSRLKGGVVYVPEVLVRMRVGGVSNRSLRDIATKSAEDYRALRANGVGGVGALMWKNVSKLPQFFRRPV